MESKHVIVPLNESNYATWKVQLKMALMREDLYSIVTGNEEAPSDDQSAAYRSYVKRRDKALATIVLAVEPKLLYLLGDPDNPADVWKKLQGTFQRKTWANKLRLRRQLYSMKLNPGDSMQLHLKKFTELFDELAVVGDAVEEEDRVINVLASLPDSFSTLVTALEAMDNVPQSDFFIRRVSCR